MNIYLCFYVKTARDVVTVFLIFAKYLSLYIHIFTYTYRGIQTQPHVYNQHTRGMATTRHRSLLERGKRKALLETLHTHTKKNQEKPIITNLKKRFEHIKLPAKLIDYFLRSNKSNINQSRISKIQWMCPSFRLWGGLDCDSQFTILSPPSFDRPQLWRSMSVCSCLHLLTRAHCAQFSPSIPLCLASQMRVPAGGRTQSPDCALRIPVSHNQRRVCSSFLLVHQDFWAWCALCWIHQDCYVADEEKAAARPYESCKNIWGLAPPRCLFLLVHRQSNHFQQTSVVWWKSKTQLGWVIKPVPHNLVRRIRFWRKKISGTWF